MLSQAFYAALHPQEDLSIEDWAQKYRILPKESSSEPGPWRNERTPYLVEIMHELSPQSHTDQVVVMAGSQLGKTEVDLNFILYTMDNNPGPMLYVQKTLEAVERFSLQRLGPSIREIPRLMEKLGEQKTRDSAFGKLQKTFPGGLIILGGANSPSSLRSMPIAYFLADEIDSYALDVGNKDQGEGDPVKLGEKRTTNFPRRKRYYSSTPNIKETSRIEPLYEGGDMRIYKVPCPFCQFKQQIKWGRNTMVYINEDPTTVRMKCTKCYKLISEKYKTWMLENGEWVKTNPKGLYPSFHISGLYSPVGFYSWEDAVADFLEAQRERSKEKLKVFVNTVLAETWTESGKSIEFSFLSSRKEEYTADVPQGALLLTAGVDVQEDRIECEVVGWGKRQESWSIEYRVFMGDTEGDLVWQDLDDFLNTRWTHESGREINIAAAAIDSGHRAKRVYKYCAPREFRRFFPVKGKGGWGNGLILRPKNRNKDGVYLFIAWVDEIKSKVYSHLTAEPKEGVDELPTGYCHFPDKTVYDDNYFQMLTAERMVYKVIQGKKVPVWQLMSGRHNEALDCRVYNVAILNIINPNFDEIELRGPVVVPTVVRKRRVGVVSKGVDA